MKKLLLVFVASFAFIQTTSAALPTSAESLRIYDAIATSPLVLDAISSAEFVVDIKRKTKDLHAVDSVYILKTILDNGTRKKSFKYRINVMVTPNPGIGPNVIIIESIQKNCS